MPNKEVRKLVDLGRLMLGIEKYKKKEISLGKASKIAGLNISEMIQKLSEYGIESHLTLEDYHTGLEHLRKTWS